MEPCSGGETEVRDAVDAFHYCLIITYIYVSYVNASMFDFVCETVLPRLWGKGLLRDAWRIDIDR